MSFVTLNGVFLAPNYGNFDAGIGDEPVDVTPTVSHS